MTRKIQARQAWLFFSFFFLRRMLSWLPTPANRKRNLLKLGQHLTFLPALPIYQSIPSFRSKKGAEHTLLLTGLPASSSQLGNPMQRANILVQTALGNGSNQMALGLKVNESPSWEPTQMKLLRGQALIAN